MLSENVELLRAEKAKQLLFLGEFSEYLKYLYQLGVRFEKDFILNLNDKKILKNKSELKKARQKYTQNQLDNEAIFDASTLLIRQQHLLSLAVAWEDPGLKREKIQNSSIVGSEENETPKKIRQSTKLKRSIDKSIRQAIHVGLIVEVARIRNETKRKLVNDSKNHERLNPEISSLGEKNLFEILKECIALNDEKPEAKDIEPIFKKAAKAISSFKPLIDKLLQALGIFIAFLAALACGLTVGGCAYLLFMGLTPVTFLLIPLIPAAIISSIGALTVFGVNFYFLYKSIPEILLSAAKMGGITEYIDSVGERAQLSRFKKILLLPAAVVSFAVGASMMAFTATNFVSILAGIIPGLALSAAPAFLPILLAILMVGLGVALSILMFKGFVWLLQKPLLELAKQAFGYMKKLSFVGWLGLGIKLLICGLSMVGLYTLYFAGIPILIPFFGPVAVLIGWAAFIGEIPFTFMMVNQLCDLAGNFLANCALKAFNFCFTRQNAGGRVEDTSAQEKTSVKLLIGLFFVTINAFLNALLVIGTSILSLVATGACFVNSFASNLIVSNRELENIRNQANDVCLKVLISENEEKISIKQNNIPDADKGDTVITNSLSFFVPKKNDTQTMNNYFSSNSRGR